MQVLLFILIPIIIIIVSVVAYFFNVWIRAFASKAHVSFGTLIGMKLRRVTPTLVVEALIRLKKAGLVEIDTDPLEAH